MRLAKRSKPPSRSGLILTSMTARTTASCARSGLSMGATRGVSLQLSVGSIQRRFQTQTDRESEPFWAVSRRSPSRSNWRTELISCRVKAGFSKKANNILTLNLSEYYSIRLGLLNRNAANPLKKLGYLTKPVRHHLPKCSARDSQMTDSALRKKLLKPLIEPHAKAKVFGTPD